MIVIDRFEGEYAVCEKSGDGKEEFFNLAKVMLPRNVREGDCIAETASGEWEVDGLATIKRRREIQERMDDLYH